MKPLSEQLEDLAQRAKGVEQSAATARAKNQAELERRRDQLTSAIESSRRKLETSAAEARRMSIRDGPT